MDLQNTIPIIEKIFVDAVDAKKYSFGGAGRLSGVGNKVATGSLRASIEAKQNGNTIEVEMVDYADDVQYGRKAGAKGVPLSAIMRWVKVKGIDASMDKPARGFDGTRRQVSLAFAINSKRKKEGKKALPIDVLLKWIKDKNIKGTIDPAKQMAFGIQKNIKKFGIKPANIINLPAEQVLDSAQFEEALSEDAVNEILKSLE
jgi:hypothetical protein